MLFVRVLVDVLFSLLLLLKCCFCCLLHYESRNKYMSLSLSLLLPLCGGSVVWGVVLWIAGNGAQMWGEKGGATEIFHSFFLSHGIVSGS